MTKKDQKHLEEIPAGNVIINGFMKNKGHWEILDYIPPTATTELFSVIKKLEAIRKYGFYFTIKKDQTVVECDRIGNWQISEPGKRDITIFRAVVRCIESYNKMKQSERLANKVFKKKRKKK